MTPCEGCGRRIARGRTAEGRLVTVDYDQAVYSVVTIKDRTELVRTTLALAVHECKAKT